MASISDTHGTQMRTYDRADSVVFRKTNEQFGGLSNMAGGFPLRVNGIRILTSEALYQACRFPHRPEVQQLIMGQTSPMTAKMKSKPYRRDSRPDWDYVRVKIMRWCLRVKLAQNWDAFSKLLLETRDRPIVEESRKDVFWGAKPVDEHTLVGMNVLGRLLMELREAVKAEGRGSFLRVEPIGIPDFLLGGRPIETITAQGREVATPIAKPIAHPLRGDAGRATSVQATLFEPPAVKQASSPEYASESVKSAGIIDLKPYPDYKDSDLPWLGEIPKHWEMVKTKYLFRERSEKGFPDEALLAATQTKGVVPKELYENRTVLALKDLHLLKLVRVGDFVISLRSFQGGIEYAHYQGIISPAYTVLCPATRANPKFFVRLLKSKPYIDNLLLFVTGIRQGQNIDYVRLSRSFLPVPCADDQEAIGTFLDHFEHRLNRLIRAKQKLIAPLNEQKQAIIHRAVTRGFDPNVRLKPSGIHWLGDVPEHWKIIPLKRIAWFKGGAGFPISEQGHQGLDIPFLKVSDMSSSGNETTMRRSENSISFTTASVLGATVFPAGAIVFPKVGGAMLTNKRRILDRPSCIDNNMMGCVVQHAERDYVLLLLHQIDLGLMSKPGPVPAVSEGEVREIRVVLPPVEEQMGIVLHVKKEIVALDTTITHIGREITLLREYRTRLIADVVTGKLDVRGVELPALTEAEALDRLEIGEEAEAEETGDIYEGADGDEQ